MRGDRRAVWVGGAAFALALLGCGSITPLDGADGGVTAPPELTASDAGILSAASDDGGVPGGGASQGSGSAPGTKDAGPPAPKMKDAGPPGQGGSGGTSQRCATKSDCSDGRVCNVATGLCVACLVDGDCKGKTKLCDLTSLTCLCPSDGDCGGD